MRTSTCREKSNGPATLHVDLVLHFSLLDLLATLHTYWSPRRTGFLAILFSHRQTRQFGKQNSPTQSIDGRQSNERHCDNACCDGLDQRRGRSGPKGGSSRAALVRFLCSFFFCRSCVFANSYLENHQPPEARTTTDILRLYQYFRMVFSDLAYGGDKVVYYVFFCSKVKIGGAGTFSAPPSTVVQTINHRKILVGWQNNVLT